MEFKSPYKKIDKRKFNTWCNYNERIDTYGMGCEHGCSYCYAKSLLSFRGFWGNPIKSDYNIIVKKIKQLNPGQIVRLGGMTDCFQPIELKHRITYNTIRWLNIRKIHYLIVTKGDIVANNEYIDLYDPKLAHFQISITNTNDNDCLKYEKATKITDRIKAVEKLYKLGFDVGVRLSPYIPEFIDLKILSDIECNKILVEFLKVNHWIKKWFDIDYSKHTFKYGGYQNLELNNKIDLIGAISGFNQVSVGEYVYDHHLYFSEKINHNRYDCCNLEFKSKKENQLKIEL